MKYADDRVKQDFLDRETQIKCQVEDDTRAMVLNENNDGFN